tara:strand:- start:1104 stop:1301 length:198 start_codon:yes stop_codon:yes gene_type:complete
MTIAKLDDESNNVYNFRVDFINSFSIDYPNLTEKDYIKYSKIAANIKFKECRYDSINYNKIKKYI